LPIDIHAAAKMVGCSVSLVRHLAQMGHVRGWKIGVGPRSQWRFHRSDVLEYIEGQKNVADQVQDKN
jgi:excisionase family DNA binding protein